MGKRKASEELSENPHTKKERLRQQNLTDIQKAYEKAKKADQTFEKRKLDKLKSTPQFQSSSVDQRNQLVQNCKDESRMIR
jgi:hypothetical protein